MEISLFSELSKPGSALMGAFIGGGLASIGGMGMLALLRLPTVAGTQLARRIFSRISPRVFYFGLVVPVWALVGAAIGYEAGGVY
ncbi:hypothetical protein [Mesorhizobium sp. CAU 1732]|uniref:hypothetical protein n=1 Tax=Mesorhizobium sp. CAU 1732 TaxID=3140358 RepID=UPI003260BE80